jgi:hypothetical protein
MTMFLRRTTKLYDPKNLTSNLQELEGIKTTTHIEAISALNNDTKGSCTISKLGVDASGMLIGSYRPRSGSID